MPYDRCKSCGHPWHGFACAFPRTENGKNVGCGCPSQFVDKFADD